MYYHYIVELHFISIIISRVSSRTADALSSDATKSADHRNTTLMLPNIIVFLLVAHSRREILFRS